MVLFMKGKIFPNGSGALVYLASGLLNDSAFPFEVGEGIMIEIKGDGLIIKRRDVGNGIQSQTA